MHSVNLSELLRDGENSGVEFKRDGLRPGRLAIEMAALLNLEGGVILIGVDDDGTVTGLSRPSRETEELVMNVARDQVQPGVIPYWRTLRLESGGRVGVISLPADAPDKPYKARTGSAWVTKVRVGTPRARRRSGSTSRAGGCGTASSPSSARLWRTSTRAACGSTSAACPATTTRRTETTTAGSGSS